MRAAVFFILPVLLDPVSASQSGGSQPRVAADCRESSECRQLALEAAERHDYETFHDLAWRAVQKGPRQDPALMYLLARAQALSGRPHDALVMIQRLARRATDVSNLEVQRLLFECAQRMGVRRPVRLLRSREHMMPMVFGTRVGGDVSESSGTC